MINNFNKQVVAVTGGAGLIGSYLVDLLVERGCKLVIIDDFSKGTIQNLTPNLNSIELREGNLEDFNFTYKALGDCDIIFHLASRAYGIGYSKNNHTNILLHNERITNNLITTFTQKKPKKILVVSSSCVYDDNGPDIIAESYPIVNEPELANLGYGWAKRIMEKKFQILSKELNVPVSIVRPFNIYGERYKWVGENSQAIPMLLKKVLDKQNPIIIWGSGNQKRNYIHAKDCAKFIVNIMENDNLGQIYNIGTEDVISIKELVNLIMKLSDIKLDVKFDRSKPEGRFIKSSDSTLLRGVVDKDKFKLIALKVGIIKMFDWYNKAFMN